MAEAHSSSVLSVYQEGRSLLADELTRFQTPQHQAQAHAGALALLPRPRYRSGLEIGCADGALTERLARRCAALLAVDRSEPALEAARERCAQLPQVHVQHMSVPEEYPSALFDLTVVAGGAAHWSRAEQRIVLRRIVAHLDLGGHFVLLHHSDDGLHAIVAAQTQGMLRHLDNLCDPGYRIDLFERV